MPIFEFVCLDCQAEFERLVRSASAEIVCPQCGSAKVRKKFSAFAAKTSSGFTPSSGGGCGGCSSHNCGSCH